MASWPDTACLRKSVARWRYTSGNLQNLDSRKNQGNWRHHLNEERGEQRQSPSLIFTAPKTRQIPFYLKTPNLLFETKQACKDYLGESLVQMLRGERPGIR